MEYSEMAMKVGNAYVDIHCLRLAQSEKFIMVDKKRLTPLISVILPQKSYHCVQYSKYHQLSLSSLC